MARKKRRGWSIVHFFVIAWATVLVLGFLWLHGSLGDASAEILQSGAPPRDLRPVRAGQNAGDDSQQGGSDELFVQAPPAPPELFLQAPLPENVDAHNVPLHAGELIGAFESNAPWPGPRPGELEIHSEVPDVLPGAGIGHAHGKLGLRPDGTCCRFVPKPLPRMDDAQRTECHRGFCFNSCTSDSIDVDRPQNDVRSSGCKNFQTFSYPTNLGKASVIMVYHNEHFAVLMRSVHSVLNHSPPQLLKEVILVDDASMYNDDKFYKRHWDRLQDELTEYCKALPKVNLVRLKERRGLMLARMEGVWRSSAEAVIFLDSHIEATPGWLEPLLARIREDPIHVVVPSIDSIDNDNFEYLRGGGLSVLGFSWTLGQKPMSRPDDDSIVKSPVMAGGLFGGDRGFFLHLGGYDPEMRLYGGEEMEIGFRTWQCGGTIEHVPCSHVGHVFRTGRYWQGQVYSVPGEEITRNKLRAAEVWMDEYKDLVKLASSPLREGFSVEPLQERIDLRKKLDCKPFKWFIDNVAPDVFVPKLTADAHTGCLQVEMPAKTCVDTLGERSVGGKVGTYQCHFQHGTQGLVMDGDGFVRFASTSYEMCLRPQEARAGVFLQLGDCNPRGGADSQWTWSKTSSQLSLRSHPDLCLTADLEETANAGSELKVEQCSGGAAGQRWKWS